MRVAAFATAVSLLSLASARIIGFAAPSTVAPDSEVRLEIITENYIQAIEDVAFSFGIYPANISYPGALGRLLSSKFLGPDLSNTIENITHIVHIPSDVSANKGQYTITGAAFSLTGAVLSPDIESYAVNVTVGETTGSEYVRSTRIEDQ